MPTSQSHPTPMLAVCEIARQISAPVLRIEYLIRSRNIQPTSHAGNVREWDEADVYYITSELRRIDHEKGGAK